MENSRLSVSEGPNPTLSPALSGPRPEKGWRRGWYANPRSPFVYTGFRGRPIQPISPLSALLLVEDRGSYRGEARGHRLRQVESGSPRDRSCVNPGLRATMRAFNPARPGREQRLGEALGDAVGSGFTHGRIDRPLSSLKTPKNRNPR